jgi:hypothetical protein
MIKAKEVATSKLDLKLEGMFCWTFKYFQFFVIAMSLLSKTNLINHKFNLHLGMDFGCR